MKRLERAPDLHMILLRMLETSQSEMWTALPATIEEYDPSVQTCTLKCAIRMSRIKRDGTKELLTIPKLLDVPVLFPSGGGYSLTFPVAKGDEVLVVFGARSIDNWWYYGQSPDGQAPMEASNPRMHDLSDGFAILGIRSKPKALLPSPSGNTLQLRSNDGVAIIELAPNHVINITGATVNVVATQSATITSPSIVLKNTGAALKKLVTDTFLTLFNAHTHMAAGTPTSVPAIPADLTNATSTVSAE